MPFPFDFILAVIAIVFAFRFMKLLMQHREERAAPLAEERDGLLERMTKLEQRIVVLERIVTDRRHELNRQFEELDP